MIRNSKMTLLFGALLFSGAVGCVEQDTSLLLEGHLLRSAASETADDGSVSMTGACVFDPSATTTSIETQGFMDLKILANDGGGQPIVSATGDVVGSRGANLFTFGAKITNVLPNNQRIYGQQSTRVDTNKVLIKGAKVTYTFNSSSLVFERSFSAIVGSGSGTLVMDLPLVTSAADVNAIEACVRQELAVSSIPPAEQDAFKVPVFVDIQVEAETLDGSDIASNIFTFPMEVCIGCTSGGNPNTPFCVLESTN